MGKQSKAKRSCKQEVLVNSEFRFKGPRREIVIRFTERERAYLVTVVVLEIVVSLVALVVAKRLVGL